MARQPIPDPPVMPGARVPVVGRDGLMTPDWYRFFAWFLDWGRRTESTLRGVQHEPVALPPLDGFGEALLAGAGVMPPPDAFEAALLAPVAVSTVTEAPVEVDGLPGLVLDLLGRMEALERSQTVAPIIEVPIP